MRQLFELGHRLEVSAGDEVVWADPHFERVWFPAGAEDAKVQRVPGGFRAAFAKPGTFRGAFTVAGGHGTNDVYDMTVVVKAAPVGGADLTRRLQARVTRGRERGDKARSAQ